MKDTHEPEDIDRGQNPAQGDDIIELTDIVSDSAGTEEPIIELADIVKAAPPDTPVAVEDEALNVIELTDVVQEHAGVMDEDVIVETIYEEHPDDDDFTDSLGVDLESGIAAPEAPSISHEQVEAAIERVVKEMLSEKIEPLLLKIIEKEISKEVERLKTLLLDDAAGNDYL